MFWRFQFDPILSLKLRSRRRQITGIVYGRQKRAWVDKSGVEFPRQLLEALNAFAASFGAR